MRVWIASNLTEEDWEVKKENAEMKIKKKIKTIFFTFKAVCYCCGLTSSAPHRLLLTHI